MINIVLLASTASATSLPSIQIPKWVNEITPNKAVFLRKANNINISARSFYAQILPSPLPKTKLFGYTGQVLYQNYTENGVVITHLTDYSESDNPIIQLTRNDTIITVRIANQLPPLEIPVDLAIVPDQIKPVLATETPIITHFHGLQTSPQSDGHPKAYYSNRTKGPTYVSANCLNCYEHRLSGSQGYSALLYHDHTMGLTRINVYKGLFGMLLVRDNPSFSLPSGEYQLIWAIYDRSFSTDGSLAYTGQQAWQPQYYGDTPVINGKAYPHFKFKRALYSITIANVANARYFNMAFKSLLTQKYINMTIISYGQGFNHQKVDTERLLLGPGERVVMLVDLRLQGDVMLQNDAPAPYPDGDSSNPLLPQLVLLKNTNVTGPTPPNIPKVLDPTLQTLIAPGRYLQQFVLVEHVINEQVSAMYLNGQTYHASYDSNTFFYKETTELYIINLTPDSHPFHTHLAAYQLVQTCDIDSSYAIQFYRLNDEDLPFQHATMFPTLTNKYLKNCVKSTLHAWQDTHTVHPSQAILLRYRVATRTQNLTGFSFDPTTGPYVAHCHMLEHEDKDLMQNIKVNNMNHQNVKLTKIFVTETGRLEIKLDKVYPQSAVHLQHIRFEANGRQLEVIGYEDREGHVLCTVAFYYDSLVRGVNHLTVKFRNRTQVQAFRDTNSSALPAIVGRVLLWLAAGMIGYLLLVWAKQTSLRNY